MPNLTKKTSLINKPSIITKMLIIIRTQNLTNALNMAHEIRNELFVTAGEAARELGASKPFAYKLARRMNEKLKEKGFISAGNEPSGRASTSI